MPRLRVLTVTSLAFSLLACDPPGPEFDPELPEPAGQSFRLRGEEDAPVLAMDSPVALRFDSDKRFFYETSEAALLPQGLVAVANSRSGEILIFDSTGTFVRAIGRAGGGPGEFQGLRSVISMGGDTIAAFDSQTRTVSLFTISGNFLESFRIETPPEASPIGGARLAGLGGRRFLVSTFAMPTEEVLNQRPNQVVQVPVVAFAADLSDGSHVIIGKFPGDDQWFANAGGREASYGRSPFARQTWFGTFNNRVIVLRNTEPGFRIFRSDGTPDAVYQGSFRARTVTDEDRDQFLARWFRDLHEEPYWGELKSSLEENGFPQKMPYYRDAIVGSDGIVWIEPYETWRYGERLYVGYDSAGVAVGKLHLPHNGRLLSIGNGVAVVHRFDEFGVENVYVQRFAQP